MPMHAHVTLTVAPSKNTESPSAMVSKKPEASMIVVDDDDVASYAAKQVAHMLEIHTLLLIAPVTG